MNAHVALEALRMRMHSDITLWALMRCREIHAMAVVHHRGMGQRFRFATARVRAIQLRKESKCPTT